MIEKGQVANCTGFLFSPKAEKNVNEAFEDAKHYKDITERLFKRKELTDKEINVLDKRLQLYITQSEVLTERLVKKEKEDFWQKTLYFGLGVLATGLAVYGAAQLAR